MNIYKVAAKYAANSKVNKLTDQQLLLCVGKAFISKGFSKKADLAGIGDFLSKTVKDKPQQGKESTEELVKTKLDLKNVAEMAVAYAAELIMKQNPSITMEEAKRAAHEQLVDLASKNVETATL